jgi:hypothetical protein
MFVIFSRSVLSAGGTYEKNNERIVLSMPEVNLLFTWEELLRMVVQAMFVINRAIVLSSPIM